MPKVAILLTDGYADWECAFLNGIGRAYYGIEITVFSPNGEKIVSMGGIHTVPQQALQAIKAADFDTLVICGGTVWEADDAPDLKSLAFDFLNAGKHVAAICGATLALAKTGILDDRKHTSNTPEFLTNGSPAYKGALFYRNEVTAVEDNNVITAPGNAPAHFTAAVFRAVGIDEKRTSELLRMLAAEHR